MNNELIRFNNPYLSGNESRYIAEAHSNKRLSGDGSFTQRCHAWFENRIHPSKVLLTHSCTAALEMAALLLNIQPGDEIIMPSYTFVSTANAFVLRGAVPVFVDVCRDTLNIDAHLIEEAITSRTRAIVPVHYAGVACDMDKITEIACQYGLKVVEDAAQGVMARYKDRDLGSIGDFGAYSFHETKNIISGEGGALLINNSELISRAEIIREKGTNRTRFIRGEVDKYTWCDIGSSFLPSEMIAAFLLAQLEKAKEITQARIVIWNYYHQLLQPLEETGFICRPYLPEYSEHNAHMYFIILSPEIERQIVLDELKRNNIQAVSHYVPLHSSPAGLRFGRAYGDLSLTNSLSERIIRLPLWIGLTQSQQERVVVQLENALNLVI
ncbi:dTDP-4-amino-4,6-dideoxy-D-glucose transaminase [Legionella antarctica]|uniref:dTDP-4-amino-4,6-dideoxy-D-glucose transaminase n=1 Tax=Legionella antarctica TaxID=2708020 RepID=A0A6F8T3J4_9GAMM|nr:dTDP-4-amino-4,6-dideoxygalactose transaminase [Legionella antarctica]BCA94968.1 dTDP-4-amino-4,6-dideoxy-D-glucose transaminase [Legionella antarctica]